MQHDEVRRLPVVGIALHSHSYDIFFLVAILTEATNEVSDCLLIPSSHSFHFVCVGVVATAAPATSLPKVIWSVINQHFCSYKVRTDTRNFCRNKFNLTGPLQPLAEIFLPDLVLCCRPSHRRPGVRSGRRAPQSSLLV